MATCKVCAVTDKNGEFYASINTYCKEHWREKVKANRKANADYYNAYDRARGNRQPPEYQAQYRTANPQKYTAVTAVGNTIRDGKMTKDVLCQFCGTYGPLHGHHRNYDKPLDVQWLCVPCHKQWHVTNGPGLNG